MPYAQYGGMAPQYAPSFHMAPAYPEAWVAMPAPPSPALPIRPSARQLEDPEFATRVKSLLHTYCQREGLVLSYDYSHSGKDHEATFVCRVCA